MSIHWDDPRTGPIDLSVWRQVKRKYGQSIVTSPPFLKGELRNVIVIMKTLQQVSITVRVFRTADILKEQWKAILRQPNEWYKTAASSTLSELLSMHAVFKAKPPSKLRNKALAKVQEALMRYYGVSGVPNLIMKVPHGALHRAAHVHKALNLILSIVSLTDEVRQRLKDTFRISHTKRKSIGEILMNSRGHAKQFDPKKEPHCNLNCKKTDHDILVGESFQGVAAFVLGHYSKDIPWPSSIDSVTEINEAFKHMLIPLNRIIEELPLGEPLEELFAGKHIILSEVFECLRSAAKHQYKRTNAPGISTEIVYKARTMLRGWVILEIDKNNGKLACMCPVKFHRAMMSMYIQDNVHYEVLPRMDRQLILDQWEWEYDMRTWDSIALFNKGKTATLPYAHLIPKQKDFSRFRQIVSYFRHPLKKVMSVAQRALLFMVGTLPPNHFNLRKTQDFLDKMKAFAQQLKFELGEDIQLMPFSLDIKEMFTALPHKAIRDAVTWLLDHAKTYTRSKYVRVPNDRSMMCGWGKSCNTFEVAQISFTQITELVRFDLNNAIFSVGNTLLKQKQGAPIGGVMSTALAITTCVYSENCFLETLGVDSRYLRVLRYVDDISGVIAIPKNEKNSGINALLLYRKLCNLCYPKELLLKPEVIRNGRFRFLETMTTVRGNEITVEHYSKNAEFIATNDAQKFYTIQHSTSFSPWRSKFGVAIARMISISQHSGSRKSLRRSVNEFIRELNFLGYSTRFVRRVCHRMYLRTDDEIWLKVTKARQRD